MDFVNSVKETRAESQAELTGTPADNPIETQGQDKEYWKGFLNAALVRHSLHSYLSSD